MILEAAEPLVDIGWEGIPNWIVAGTSIATLLAAIAAGFFAYRAAHWTKQQAIAARKQTSIADTELGLARDQLALTARQLDDANTRADEERAARHQEEMAQTKYRLDAIAPTVLITAYDLHLSAGDGLPLTDPLTLEAGADDVFTSHARIEIENFSNQIACIDVIDPAYGTIGKPGVPFVLPPGKSMVTRWERKYATSLMRTEEALYSANNALARPTFHVRDMAGVVRDTYILPIDNPYFSLDGSRMIVTPRPDDTSVAVPVGTRHYERFDGESPAPEE